MVIGSMMNTANGSMSPSSSSSSANAQAPGLKTYFKTPEGRYKLHYEKTHSSALLHYAHGKTVSQVSSLFFFFPSIFFIHIPYNLGVSLNVILLPRVYLQHHFGLHYTINSKFNHVSCKGMNRGRLEIKVYG